MAKKKVCISFDYEHDKDYRNLIAAWNANPNFEFAIKDKTPNEIQSTDYSRIKAVLTQKICDATYLLVVIGKYANQKDRNSDKIGDLNWQNWEINKAKAIKKKIIGVKLDRSYDSPIAILNSGATFVYGFTEEGIISALNRA